MTPLPVGDSLLRVALMAMALDPGSALTEEQRAWIIGLTAQRTTAFTASERARLKAPLLAWAQERMPRCLDLIAKQL